MCPFQRIWEENEWMNEYNWREKVELWWLNISCVEVHDVQEESEKGKERLRYGNVS